MHAWEQIQQTIEYIECHMDEELTIKELADLAGLSPFYFQRLFTKLVKKPVKEYMKMRRLAKAMEVLQECDDRILDIAISLGFSSHEHFTRAFKETFSMTPEQFRKHPQTLNRMTKPELLLQYTIVDVGVPLISDGIVLEINEVQLEEDLSFIGLSKSMPVQFVDGLGIESGLDPLYSLWETLHKEKEALLQLPQNQEEIGVSIPSRHPNEFIYFAGTRMNQPIKPHGYETYTLSKGAYLVVSFEAETFEALIMDALYKAQQYTYGVWLPNHHMHTEPFCTERYAAHGPKTTSMELWLKILDENRASAH